MLDEALKSTNRLHFDMDNDCIPMVYPYMTENNNLKRKLIENKIFVATYWPNVMDWCEEKDWEYLLARQACFLPVDQRYSEKEMNDIISCIL